MTVRRDDIRSDGVRTRRRWAIAGLAVYAAAAAVILLAPVSYGGIIHAIANVLRGIPGMPAFGDGWVEFTANIALFVPMGFLLTLLFRHPWYGAILAVVVSAGVEIAQIVIPDRQPSLRDIVSNSIGAVIGAFLAWLIVLLPARLRERRRAREASADAADDAGGQTA
jgi:hypothetical protein